MMRYYQISIDGVGDILHRTDENVVDFNQIVYDRFPDLVGSYRITVMITSRDPVTHHITSMMHLSMRICLP